MKNEIMLFVFSLIIIISVYSIIFGLFKKKKKFAILGFITLGVFGIFTIICVLFLIIVSKVDNYQFCDAKKNFCREIKISFPRILNESSCKYNINFDNQNLVSKEEIKNNLKNIQNSIEVIELRDNKKFPVEVNYFDDINNGIAFFNINNCNNQKLDVLVKMKNSPLDMGLKQSKINVFEFIK